MKRIFVAMSVALYFIGISFPSNATSPPPDTATSVEPNWFLKDDLGKFVFKRAFLPLVANVLRNRMAIQGGVGLLPAFDEIPSAGPPMGPALISGIKQVPVLLVRFKNTTGDLNKGPLYHPKLLQAKLFGLNPEQYSMTTYYRETSYGAFTVSGTVADWVTVSRDDSYYEGVDYEQDGKKHYCTSLCPTGHLGELIREVLDLNPEIDWGQHDNDGPDGIPNSGDDDGFVDFIAIVHSEAGSECTAPGRQFAKRNIWSHRYSLSNLVGQEYTTKIQKHGGGYIKIDDYTIQPGYGCDGFHMVDIGVFAHEFGHAFGLPDLYDTNRPPTGEGVGNWCLMGGGAWGGDGKSPDRPVQMSVWAKEFLGWIAPYQVAFDQNVTIPPIEDHPVAYKIRISPNMYYLVNTVSRKFADLNLPGEGLQVWQINESMIRAGLRTNRVNADPSNKGVDLVEANSQNNLDIIGHRGQASDVFIGLPNRVNFDSATSPKSLGSISICGITRSLENMTAQLRVSSNKCN